jgi:flagellar hook assembly protein FlgD
LGAKVRALVNDDYRSGQHEVVWDGRNDAGALVGSGVYLVRLQHSGKTRVQRVNLLK